MKTEVLSYEGGILWGTARVQFTPNKIGRFFGRKEEIRMFEWEGSTYTFGGERKWFDKKTGKEIGRFPKIDNYIRKVKFNTKPEETVVETPNHYDAFYYMEDLKKR